LSEYPYPLMSRAYIRFLGVACGCIGVADIPLFALPAIFRNDLRTGAASAEGASPDRPC
jgi:hypothetical protein